MERSHHPTRAMSELSPPSLDVKQSTAASRPHPPVVLHGLPASRPFMSRGPSTSYTYRPVTTASAPRLLHQKHGYHSSDSFVYQHPYARPVAHESPLGVAYTHHVTSGAEPVPIGNRDIIVSPAEERCSSSPTTGAASKLFLSVKRTLSLKKPQPPSAPPPMSFIYELESPRPPTPPEIHQIATGTKSPLPLLRRTKTGPSHVPLPPPPAHSSLKKTSTLSSETSSTASGSTGPLTPESGSRSGSSMSGPVDQPRLWKKKTMLSRLLGGKREKTGSLGENSFLASDESARSVTPPARKSVRFLTENDDA